MHKICIQNHEILINLVRANICSDMYMEFFLYNKGSEGNFVNGMLDVFNDIYLCFLNCFVEKALLYLKVM